MLPELAPRQRQSGKELRRKFTCDKLVKEVCHQQLCLYTLEDHGRHYGSLQHSAQSSQCTASDISSLFYRSARRVSQRSIQHCRLESLIESTLRLTWIQNARIADLTTYLRAIRPSYLSTAPAPRRPQRQNSTDHKSTQDTAQRHLSDTERAAIDAEAKTVLRQLHAAVERIGQTEQIRQDTASHVALRKRNQGGLGAIGRWAAGGAVTAKSAEEELEEARQKMLNAHRESIVWYLQAKLRETGTLQSTMMEIRIQREVEKSKSVLYKTKGSSIPFSQSFDAAVDSEKSAAQEQERAQPQLSDEQMQLFAQENQDMMKHYQDTLDQVRYVLEMGPISKNRILTVCTALRNVL